jgi:hypothetical protein
MDGVTLPAITCALPHAYQCAYTVLMSMTYVPDAEPLVYGPESVN